MIERIYRIFGISGIFLVFVIFLASCATVEIPKQADTEESLRNTASLYWKMRIESKFEDTFKMEEKEGLIKGNTEGLPLNEYYKAKAIISGPVTSYSIKNVKVLNDKGRVDVEFLMAVADIPKPVRQILTDEWAFRNGKWQHLFR